ISFGTGRLMARTIDVSAARQPPLNTLKESLVGVAKPRRPLNARDQRQKGSIRMTAARAMLPERRTGATLGDMQLRSHLLNAGTRRAGLRSFPEQPPAGTS